MATEKLTTSESNFPHSTIESKIPEPRFVVRETLDAIESVEADSWDDTDWQDFLSHHAGVAR